MMNTFSRLFNRCLTVVAIAALLLVASTAVACGGNTKSGGSQNNGPIAPTWIQTEDSGDTASISLNEVEIDRMTHFTVNTSEVQKDFMAYELGGKTYVRASICPPCFSKSFSLVGDTLVCDRCGTVFDAETGLGISGACVNYPKASVPYAIDGDNIIMEVSDLESAYNDTVEPGLP